MFFTNEQITGFRIAKSPRSGRREGYEKVAPGASRGIGSSIRLAREAGERGLFRPLRGLDCRDGSVPPAYAGGYRLPRAPRARF